LSGFEADFGGNASPANSNAPLLFGAPMEYTPVTVVETAMFRRKASQHLSREAVGDLIGYLALHPQSGVLMRGAGGVRKLRWGRRGMGKRGGLRVIYFFHNELMPLYLLTVFGKNEQSDLSSAERKALRSLVKTLVRRGGH
jgi:hypothetical protein